MSWRQQVAALKREVRALALAARHPRTPWYARALALAVVAYALSPLDPIPDVVPVLGHLDDLVLVPLGIWLVIRLLPPDLLQECRARAATSDGRPATRLARVAAGAIVIVWVATAVAVLYLARGRFSG